MFRLESAGPSPRNEAEWANISWVLGYWLTKQTGSMHDGSTHTAVT